MRTNDIENREYYQITLDVWMEMKERLKRELLGIKQSFVRIGYVLRQIDDGKLYERDGYKSIAEFAEAEYGLKPSTTSRFMSINREYSVDGYSEHLRPEFADLGRSQLEEMLMLSDKDRQMIRPETSREDIRDLKRFNRETPEKDAADDIRQLVERFYYDNPGILNAVFSEPAQDDERANTKKMKEIINPGGSRSYRKGLFFLMMYENKIAIKKFGDDPWEMTWEEFIRLTADIFKDAAAGPRTWQTYFEEELEKPDSEPTKEIAPAQKSQESTKTKAKQTEKKEPLKSAKETEKESGNAAEEAGNDAEESEKVVSDTGITEDKGRGTAVEKSDAVSTQREAAAEIMTRKAYIDKLTLEAAAFYICNEFTNRRSLTVQSLRCLDDTKAWLLAKVDENGREADVEENGGKQQCRN